MAENIADAMLRWQRVKDCRQSDVVYALRHRSEYLLENHPDGWALDEVEALRAAAALLEAAAKPEVPRG